MARFDLFEHRDGFLLDVQADTLDELNTRVVVPLRVPGKAPLPGRRLNPEFDIDGQRYVMVTQFIAAVPDTELRKPKGNIAPHRDRITAALDMLFQGF